MNYPLLGVYVLAAIIVCPPLVLAAWRWDRSLEAKRVERDARRLNAQLERQYRREHDQ